jgi:hypothetical protein
MSSYYPEEIRKGNIQKESNGKRSLLDLIKNPGDMAM